MTKNFRELLFSTQKGWLNFYCYANVTDEIGNTLNSLSMTCDNGNVARMYYTGQSTLPTAVSHRNRSDTVVGFSAFSAHYIFFIARLLDYL